MTARMHDLSLRLALRRALAGEVRACPTLADEAARERCGEWLADEPPDSAEDRDEHDSADLNGDEHDSAEEREERSTAAAQKPPLEA